VFIQTYHFTIVKQNLPILKERIFPIETLIRYWFFKIIRFVVLVYWYFIL